MTTRIKDAIVVLGPTASGKTALACALAARFGGEILSADSRQVYRGLDIGSGKDLSEYVVEGTRVPYHLIDIVDLDEEYNVFRYQRDFFATLEGVQSRDSLPIVAGGTGLYLNAVLRGYALAEVPVDPALRQELADASMDELRARLSELRPDQHNTTDSEDRERAIRAIEIAAWERDHPPEPLPLFSATVVGIDFPKDVLHARIDHRLRERLENGLVEEVEGLLQRGVSAERLRLLGLEYRFVTDYLDGTIKSRNDLRQKLSAAIKQFAKRQRTWFRRMERQGTDILWLSPRNLDDAVTRIGDVMRKATETRDA